MAPIPTLSNQVAVKEAYRDYVPPVDVTAIVRQLLETVPDKYLTGLDCIVLTNAAGLSRKDRVGKVWSRKRKFEKSNVRGRYHGGSGSSLPYVELRVDKVLRSLQGLPLHIPFLRNIVFGQVLFHEIGHHIHRKIRPEYNEREDVADKWAGKLNGNFVRRKYWYAMPVLILTLKLYKFLRRK